MNYYLPYMTPYIGNTSSTGLLSKIFKNGINWSSFLTNAQKTLNIVNQTIPVIKQMKPVVNNAKTMFKIMNEFKKVDTPKPNEKVEIVNSNADNPTFFQ